MARDQTLPLPDEVSASLNRVGFGLGNHNLDSLDVADAIYQISKLHPQRISHADSQIANAAGLYWWELPPTGVWSRLFPKPSRLQLLEHNDALKFLYIFHRDGRLREAALNRITEPLTSSFFLASIIWRLNDWALPVRNAAVKCAERTFPISNCDVVAETALALISNLNYWGRWCDEKRMLDIFLERSDVLTSLAYLIETRRTGPTANALRMALVKPGLDGFLMRIARDGVQPNVRAVAIQTLADGYASWSSGFDWQWIDKPMGVRRRIKKFEQRPLEIPPMQSQAIAIGISDRSPAVRRATMSALIRNRNKVDETSEIAKRLINDHSLSVREKAEYLLATGA